MNSRLNKKVIFKQLKPDTKIATLRLRKLKQNKLDELTKHSYFRVWITQETFSNLINTIQLWREDQNKPKLKDFICIKESEHLGYTVIFQTMTQQKLTVFKHHFGSDFVEAAEDLKGIRGLDVFELDLDRNVDDFFRPQLKGPQCMSDEVLEQLYTNWTEDQDKDHNQDQNQDNNQNQNKDQDNNRDDNNNHSLPVFLRYDNNNQPEENRSDSLDQNFDKLNLGNKMDIENNDPSL